MPNHGSPTVRRRRLAGELHRLRDQTGLTGDQVAEQLGWSPSKISRIENARSGVRLADARRLLDVYGVEGAYRDALLALTRDAAGKGWWEGYSGDIPDEYATLIGMEAEAESVCYWEPQVVTGLLQTEAYARAVIATWQSLVTTPPGTIERRVEARLARQGVLTRERALKIFAVLDESVLSRRYGDNCVMFGQLERLAEISQLPNVRLQILPLDGSHPVGTGAFALFRFAPAHDVSLPDVAVIEGLANSRYAEGETETFHYRVAFERLQAESLDSVRSRELIREVAHRTWLPA